jgi:ComF family protein
MGLAWSQTLKNLIFPIFCRECGTRLLIDENPFYCPTCWDLSPRVERPFCTVCGKPHPSAVGLGVRTNFLCADCRDHPNPHVGRIFGAAVYDGPVQEVIKLLKFHDRPWAARPLGELIEAFALEEMDTAAYDLILPVPLHRVRARDRGFNQSELIAREIAHCFPHATVDLRLQRIRPTQAQSKLHGEARRENVRGAFAVVGEDLDGANVLLIDDVVTSATTVTECARALRLAGAGNVDVAAVALAVSPLARMPLHD